MLPRLLRSHRLLMIGLLIASLGIASLFALTDHSKTFSTRIISPDGLQIAAGFEESVQFGIMGAGRTLSKRTGMAWWPNGRRGATRKATLATWDGTPPRTYFDMLWVRGARFSPDSRLLAALAQGHLHVIDTSTGSHSVVSPTNDQITSFTWHGPATIRYLANPRSRVVYQHQIGDQPDRRSRIYGGIPSQELQGDVAPEEWWSPSGRYMMLRIERTPSLLRLVDLESLQAHDLGVANGSRLTVSWKPDESQVYCATFHGGGSELGRAILVSLPAADVVDLTSAFTSALRLSGIRSCGGIDGSWTADGLYLVVNCDDGGYLVQPDPWGMIALGHEVKKTLLDAGSITESTAKPAARVRSFPVPGWAVVEIGHSHWLANYVTPKVIPFRSAAIARTSRGLVCDPPDACDELPDEIRGVMDSGK